MNSSRSPTVALLSILMLLTNFVSGASIMIVEIAGARLIAPIVGNSLYTWTALISVVLVALAAGGWLGGYLADRRDGRGTLAILLVLSAATVLLIPPVSTLSISAISSMGFITAPMLLSVILFSIPAFLQGAISPLATRIISRQHHDKSIGLSAGLVNASGALGSFVGTLIAGFYLVPNFELRTIFMGVACALFAFGMACAIAYVLMQRQLPVRLALITGCTLLLSYLTHQSVTYRYADNVQLVRQSPYHLIRVTDIEEEGGRIVRQLVHDRTVQGYKYTDSTELPKRYQQTWELSTIYLPGGIDSALFVGGGSFSIPVALHEHHPNAQVTVVEIDPMVVQTGRQWFGLDNSPSINVIEQDARRYLLNSHGTYDFIYLDAYNGLRQVPAHLVTREFFAQIRQRLDPDGLVMINLIGNIHPPYSSVFDAVYKTLSSEFEHVDVFIASDAEQQLGQVYNLTIVAGNRLLDPVDTNTYASDRHLDALVASFVPEESFSGRDAPILTDELNPIDALIAHSLGFTAR